MILPSGHDLKDVAEVYRAIFRNVKRMIKEYAKVRDLLQTTMARYYGEVVALERTQRMILMSQAAKCPDRSKDQTERRKRAEYHDDDDDVREEEKKKDS